MALRRRQAEQPLVDSGQIDPDGLPQFAQRWIGRHQTEFAAVPHSRHHLGRGDQRLGGHHIGQHRRAAHALVLDEGHRAAELSCHHGRLVPARSATNDHHVRHGTHCGGRAHCWPGIRSMSASQSLDDASEGIRQSPRGDSDPPATTFGPFGNADRLNWLAKNRLP